MFVVLELIREETSIFWKYEGFGIGVCSKWIKKTAFPPLTCVHKFCNDLVSDVIPRFVFREKIDKIGKNSWDSDPEKEGLVNRIRMYCIFYFKASQRTNFVTNFLK